MTRQSSNGAFGLWAADQEADDLWLDAFVTDFLTRARERGFAVPQIGFDNALDHLRNTALNAADPGEGAGEPLAYALYVLARNGRPVIGDLRYLADTKLDPFKTPMARAQIGAALAMLGDRARGGARVRRRADHAGGSKGHRLLAARLRLEAARRRGRARAARRGQARRRRGAGRRARPRERRRRRRARRDRLHLARRRTTGSRSPPRRSPSGSRANALTLDGKPVKGALYRRWSAYRVGAELATLGNNGETPLQAGDDDRPARR